MAIVGLTSPFRKKRREKASPTRWVGLAMAGIGAGMKLYQGYKARKDAKKELRARKMEEEKRKQDFMNIEFVNPYANLQNPYAENIYEDLTVDTQAADYARQQSQQSQANVLQSFRGAAGGSGIAALAQSISAAGTAAAQKSSASISQQEKQNQLMALKGAEQKREGAFQTDLMKRQGEASRRQQEQQRTANLYGLSMQQTMGAQSAVDASTQQIQQGWGDLATAGADYFGVGGEGYGTLGNLFQRNQSSAQFGGGGGLSFSNPSFGHQISGGIQGPTLDYKGDPKFKNLSNLTIR